MIRKLFAALLLVGASCFVMPAPSIAQQTIAHQPQGSVVEAHELITAAKAAAPAVSEPFRYEVRMYGMTGLLGRLMGFSMGVDTVLNDVSKQYPTIKTYPRSHWQKSTVYESVKANYRLDGDPIILLGHSLGADAATWVAWKLLEDGIPVAAVFAYDPTSKTLCVPRNVQVAIGWQRTYVGLGGAEISRCYGQDNGDTIQNYVAKDGELKPVENHDVVGSHTYLDDAPAVHGLTLKHVGDVLHMTREMKGAVQ